MFVEIIKPLEELKSIIKSYTIIETTVPMETTVLPHLGLVIAIQYKGSVLLINNNKSRNISAMTVSGIRRNFRRFFYKANAGTILIYFTETGAFSLFGKAVFDLFGSAEPLDNLVKSSLVNELQERVEFAQSNQERIKLIEKFIISSIKISKPDKLVLNAITEIQTSKGLNRIKHLSNRLNIGQDAFEKRFRSKPFKSTSGTPFEIESLGEAKTKVKWTMQGRMNYPLNIALLFINMDSFLGKDVQKSLENLKSNLEKQ
jgi:hypothetical protein